MHFHTKRIYKDQVQKNFLWDQKYIKIVIIVFIYCERNVVQRRASRTTLISTLVRLKLRFTIKMSEGCKPYNPHDPHEWPISVIFHDLTTHVGHFSRPYNPRGSFFTTLQPTWVIFSRPYNPRGSFFHNLTTHVGHFFTTLQPTWVIFSQPYNPRGSFFHNLKTHVGWNGVGDRLTRANLVLEANLHRSNNGLKKWTGY
jgi:hypothetical protein